MTSFFIPRVLVGEPLHVVGDPLGYLASEPVEIVDRHHAFLVPGLDALDALHVLAPARVEHHRPEAARPGGLSLELANGLLQRGRLADPGGPSMTTPRPETLR